MKRWQKEGEEMEGKIKAAKKPLRKVGGDGNVDLNGTQKVSHGTRRQIHAQAHAHRQYSHTHTLTAHRLTERRADGWTTIQIEVIHPASLSALK